MCGIAGWVEYDRNLEACRDTVSAMVDTMSRRGPDAGGVWISGPAALGHRRYPSLTLKAVSSRWRPRKMARRSPA
jgi:asparagine synthase (glutamine-hydrolysing)